MSRDQPMRRRMTTIQDIAAELGLSAMTVSRALNGHPDVKDETRARVEERARELNYRPNRFARGLVSRQSKLIGVVIPEISHTFFSEITGGIQEAIEPDGYTLILCNSAGSPERERREVDMLVGGRVDGLIAASTFPQDDPELYAGLAEEGVPFVLIDRYFPALESARVHGDDDATIRLCVEHLANLGHRDIGFIRGPDVSTSSLRLAGFRESLRALGLRENPDWIVPGGFTVDAGREAGLQLLQRPSRPTAICAVNDPCALGLAQSARRLGLKVPQDLSITGVGKIEPDYLPEQYLTTTEWSRAEIGATAGRTLLAMIGGGSPADLPDVMLSPKLVIGRSTGPPPSR